jgi:NAD(P)-dependent dehydrogenase (short-subunit alcohol dehydrogenase family)
MISPAHTQTAPAILVGATVLITGANTGIGRVTARELARRGTRVFAACLSQARTQPLIDEVKAIPGAGPVEWLALDLASLSSVRACANSFLSRDIPLHLLINNAGLAGAKGLTQDGFERTFGVNHLGHFLLSQLLLERIKASAPARIVTVASRAHFRARELNFETLRQSTRSFTAIEEYCVSKLANVLFSAELARRLHGTQVSTYSLHPGVVATDVWRHVPWPLRQIIMLRGLITAEEGALTTLHCATSSDVTRQSGLYWDRGAPKLPSALAQDAALAQALWQWSERACRAL